MNNKIQVRKSDNQKNNFWLSPFFDYQQKMLHSMQKISPAWILPACEKYEMSNFDLFRRESQKIWSSVYNGKSMFMPWLTGSKTEPYIDIVEEETRFKVFADVPGVDANTLKIEYTDDALIIEGYRARHIENDRKYIRNECCHGHFSRTIALPADADLEHMTANLDKNVLEIEIPKRVSLPESTERLKTNDTIKAVA